MRCKHARAVVSAVFDDPNLVSAAGLVPVMRLALVAGMVAGTDSIDDMNLLRHGGMRRLFEAVYAPSTLGTRPLGE